MLYPLNPTHMCEVSNDVWISVTAWEYFVLSGQVYSALHCSLQFLLHNNEVLTFGNKCGVCLLLFGLLLGLGFFSILLGGLFLDRVVVVYFVLFSCKVFQRIPLQREREITQTRKNKD